MKYGGNWTEGDLPLELQKECEGKVSDYFRWKLNSVNDRYAHVFLCDFLNQEELEKYWKRIVSNIAVYVQSKLENLLERSNFYVWFFVTGDVSMALKREIENDTYSSKKIVICKNNIDSLEERLSLIEKRIFRFSFEVENIDKNMIEQVEIQNFRIYKGNHKFTFCKDKNEPNRLVVLFAPNGMGKTSFFDAVEWSLTGEIDRFSKIKNRNIDGAILRNMEAATDAPAFVKLFTEDGAWLNRKVKKLSDSAVIDSGKGSPSASKDNELKKYLGDKKNWENLILQHHKIDGFVSAEKPEDLYKEWGILWDPSKEKREEFEQNHKILKDISKKLKEEKEKLGKTRDEYKLLDAARPFVSELECNIKQYKELSGDEQFEHLDFTKITSNDYVKWSDDVDKILEKTKLELEKYSFAYSYYLSDLNMDINQYNEAWKQKNQYEVEKQDAIQKLKEIKNKIFMEAQCSGYENKIKDIEAVSKEQQFLVTQGDDWYKTVEIYFNSQEKKGELNIAINEVRGRIHDSEEEEAKLRIELEEKRICRRDKVEYGLLQEHLKIIDMLQNENALLFDNELEKKKVLIQKQKSADILKNVIEYWRKLQLADFCDTWNKYLSGEFKRIKNDEDIPEMREVSGRIQHLLVEYEKLINEIDIVSNEIQTNEVILKELGGILEASRKLIKDSQLRYCPVCNTEFVTPDLLLQNTYQPVSEKGRQLKHRLSDLDQQKRDQIKLVEKEISESNVKVRRIIEAKESEWEHLNDIIGKLKKDIDSFSEKQKDIKAQVAELQQQDQGRGLYVTYSQEGIESWYSLWDFKLCAEIKDLEQRQEQKTKEINAYKETVVTFEMDLSTRNKEWAQQYEEIAQLFVKVKEPKLYIGKVAYKDIEKELLNSNAKKSSLQSELNACRKKLQEYINADENEKKLWEQKQFDCDKTISMETVAMKQCFERMRMKLLANDLGVGENQELPEAATFQDYGKVLSNAIEYLKKTQECLEKMKYNREIDKYFSNWEKTRVIISEGEKKEESLMLQFEDAKHKYQDAKTQIEEGMQTFLQEFQVSDIYEKLEPHEKFKRLVCEFDFLEDDKPYLMFKAMEEDGKAYSPEWYFSTAQLNVVAFSLFLGRTLMSKNALLKSILIDDPVGHFDEMNIIGFADLVRNIVENTDRQLIISTHEERVFNLIRRKLPELEYPAQYIDFRQLVV